MTEERYIELKFERGGVIKAKLLEEKAPKTIEAIWNALPFETTAKQARTVQFETYFETSHIISGLSPENLTPGEFGAVQFGVDPYNNICIYCGDTSLKGIAAPYNEFAQVPKEYLDRLAEIGTRIWEKGFEKVTISRG